MKILLLGKNGQVGRELQQSLAALGELVVLGRQKVDGLCADLSDLLRLSKEPETLSIIADQIGVPTGADLIADESSAYPIPARRLLNSRLNRQKLHENSSMYLPSWQTGKSRNAQGTHKRLTSKKIGL
jgi:dTDP-4-dehydrorhamnose reductase